jgi:hypothetical protein
MVDLQWHAAPRHCRIAEAEGNEVS